MLCPSVGCSPRLCVKLLLGLAPDLLRASGLEMIAKSVYQAYVESCRGERLNAGRCREAIEKEMSWGRTQEKGAPSMGCLGRKNLGHFHRMPWYPSMEVGPKYGVSNDVAATRS